MKKTSSETLKELCNEIHGKEIVYSFENKSFNCVILALPEQGQIVIKPLDSAEEVFEKLGPRVCSWEEVNKPTFCFASFKMRSSKTEEIRIEVFEKLKVRSRFHFLDIAEISSNNTPPICLY